MQAPKELRLRRLLWSHMAIGAALSANLVANGHLVALATLAGQAGRCLEGAVNMVVPGSSSVVGIPGVL